MKLAFVAPANSVHTVRWVNAMARRGLEVTLFSLACHPARTGAIEPAVQICYLPGSGMAGYYTAAPRLRSALRRGGFDVVNAHYASGYGTLARLAGARPLLLNVWGSDVYEFPYQGRIKHTILLRNLRYADRIASTSHAMADQVRLLLGEPDREIPVTPFGSATSVIHSGSTATTTVRVSSAAAVAAAAAVDRPNSCTQYCAPLNVTWPMPMRLKSALSMLRRWP